MTATQPRPAPSAPADGDALADGEAGLGGEAGPGGKPAPSAPAAPLLRRTRTEQAREDTDAAWGDYPDSNDERLYRDRPPHWADF